MERSWKNTKYIKETTRLEKGQKHYLKSNQKIASMQILQKNASMQILCSAFLDRIQKAQNSNYEYDLFEKIDCFIDGNGSVNREHVNFFNF